MLNTLKTHDWVNIPPLRFYMMPLRQSLDKCIDILRRMRELGPLRCSYYIERNGEIHAAIIETIAKDVIV